MHTPGAPRPRSSGRAQSTRPLRVHGRPGRGGRSWGRGRAVTHGRAPPPGTPRRLIPRRGAAGCASRPELDGLAVPGLTAAVGAALAPPRSRRRLRAVGSLGAATETRSEPGRQPRAFVRAEVGSPPALTLHTKKRGARGGLPESPPAAARGTLPAGDRSIPRAAAMGRGIPCVRGRRGGVRGAESTRAACREIQERRTDTRRCPGGGCGRGAAGSCEATQPGGRSAHCCLLGPGKRETLPGVAFAAQPGCVARGQMLGPRLPLAPRCPRVPRGQRRDASPCPSDKGKAGWGCGGEEGWPHWKR